MYKAKKYLYAGALSMLALVASNIYSYAYLPDDISISNVLIVNAHNSPQSKKYGWWYYQQLGSLQDQWKAGARGGKINLHWRMPISWVKQAAIESGLRKPPKDKPFIGLCHEPDGSSNCVLSRMAQKKGKIDKAVDYFRTFAQLLERNPRDVAIIVIEDYLVDRSKKNGANRYSAQEVKDKLHQMLRDSGLAKYALKLEPKHYPQGDRPAEPWPTVGQMRASGKRPNASKRQTCYYIY